MNPEITIQDFQGKLNADSGTAARLIRGGSWKRQRIVCIIPADSKIPAKCALAMWNLIWPPNQPVVRILCTGCEVGHAYSLAIDQVLAHPDLSQFEYILTIEMDNAPPQDGVIRLLEQMEKYPEYERWGKRVDWRMLDLLKPFQSFTLYHPEEHGSCSLKSVLPALTGHGYSTLAIHNGGMAAREFGRIMAGVVTAEEAAGIRKNLEAYCSTDTSGMLDILRVMRGMAG